MIKLTRSLFVFLCLFIFLACQKNHIVMNATNSLIVDSNSIKKNIINSTSMTEPISKNNFCDEIFVEYEQGPTFPGGDIECIQFLCQNLNLEIVGDSNLERGIVWAAIEIDTNGKIGNVRIKKSYNKIIDDEFVRIIRLMPNWEPFEFLDSNINWKKMNTTFNFPLKIPFESCKE